MRREFHVRFCEGGRVRFPSATRLVYLHHICVRPSYRRQGVGRALMDAVRSAASERGITVFAEPA